MRRFAIQLQNLVCVRLDIRALTANLNVHTDISAEIATMNADARKTQLAITLPGTVNVLITILEDFVSTHKGTSSMN